MRARPASRDGREACEIGGGGPLEPVAECVELGVELGHRVLSMGSKRCLRRALRPRETRARTACGVVAEALGRLVVAEVLDDAQADRLLLSLGEVRERLVEAVEPAFVRLGHRLARACVEHAEPLAGAALQPSPAHADEQHVARDAEEPRPGGAARLVAEAHAREPGLRERLGGQVVRGVGVAAASQVIAVDAIGVALVELAERARIRARGGEQFGVAPHSRSLTVGMFSPFVGDVRR